MKAKIIGVCAAVALLAGCGVLQTINENEMVARDAMTIVTYAAIEQSNDRPHTARDIVAAAKDAKTWLDLDGVTIEELASKARQRIAESDRELSEKAGFTLLLNRADAELKKRISEGALDPNAKVTVNAVLDWVIDAAAVYAGS